MTELEDDVLRIPTMEFDISNGQLTTNKTSKKWATYIYANCKIARFTVFFIQNYQSKLYTVNLLQLHGLR